MAVARTRAILLCGLAALFGPISPSLADTILVPEDYSTIQEAIDAASDGDEIVVAPGSYVGSINTLGKAVHLRSAQGPEVTAIIADPETSVVRIGDGEGPDTIIEGFRISGGTGRHQPPPNEEYTFGGGFDIFRADPTIINCLLTDNTAVFGGGAYLCESGATFIDCSFIDMDAGNGGGIEIRSGNPTLIGCLFLGNRAFGDVACDDSGGAISNASGELTVVDCTFIANRAGDSGGAIMGGGNDGVVITGSYFADNIAGSDRGGAIYGEGPIIIRDCVFRQNSAWAGGAISMAGESVEISQCLFDGNVAEGAGAILFRRATVARITNCTFVDNAASVGAALLVDSGADPSTLDITNCVFRDGGDEIFDGSDSTITVTFSNVEEGYDGEGNIDVDPLFVDVDAGDFRLSAGSPCVDAGDNMAVPLDLFDLDEDEDTEEPVPFDLAGDPRFVDDPATEDTGSCGLRCNLPIVDMGAYEFQPGQCGNLNCDTGEDCGSCPMDCGDCDGTLLVPAEFPSIQSAIRVAADGDEIRVSPGTYREAIDFLGKAVTLRSTGGAAETTIDAARLGRSVVTCTNGEGPGTVLEGFTITGGYGTLQDDGRRYGGGMNCIDSGPTVRQCIFRRNAAPQGGGGMSSRGGSPIVMQCAFVENHVAHASGGGLRIIEGSPAVSDCTFVGNTSISGGGLAWLRGNGLVERCTFGENRASRGGGIVFSLGNLSIIDCTFDANQAGTGGGLYVSDGRPYLIGCGFFDNVAEEGGGMGFNIGGATVVNSLFSGNRADEGGAVISFGATGTLFSNTTFFANQAARGRTLACVGSRRGEIDFPGCIMRSGGDEIWIDNDSTITVNHSNVEGGYEGEGNIDADPLFVDADAGDYRLSTGSPCIDAGDNMGVPLDVLDLDQDGDTEEPLPFDFAGLSRFVDDPATEDTGRCGLRCDLPIVDMGAHEFQVIGGCVRDPQWICDGDVDGDGQVNPVDAGLVQASFCAGEDCSDDALCQYDVDCDGQINPVDSGIVQSLFGTCEEPRAACP